LYDPTDYITSYDEFLREVRNPLYRPELAACQSG